MAQTSDGYLWLSTFNGLARFDGKRFQVFGNDQIPELSGDVFTTLRADVAGNLWLRGEHNRVVVGRNGHFRQLSQQDGMPPVGATVLEAAADGTIWIGDEKGRLLRYEQGHFAVVEDAPPSPDWGPIYSLQVDAAGNAWTWSDKGCARLAGGKWLAVLPPTEGVPARAMRLLRDASLVFVRGDRLFRYANGQVSDLGLIPGGFYGYFIAEDANGDLWVSCRGGVLRREPSGRWGEFTSLEGLPAEKVRSELLDREGNRWFGIDGGGLLRLKRRAVQALGSAEGLRKKIALSLGVDATNNAWVATLDGGLNRFDGIRFSQVLFLPWLEADSLAWCVRPARDGGVWLGTYNQGLFYLNAQGTGLRRFDAGGQPGMISGIYCLCSKLITAICGLEATRARPGSHMANSNLGQPAAAWPRTRSTRLSKTAPGQSGSALPLA